MAEPLLDSSALDASHQWLGDGQCSYFTGEMDVGVLLPMKLRVLTYNIHKGFHHLKRKRVLHLMRDAIRDVHADLVFLGEGEQTWPAAIRALESGKSFESGQVKRVWDAHDFPPLA